MKKIQIIAYQLSEYEMKIVRRCLEYAKHRLLTEPEAGIGKAVKLSEVENLLNEIKI